MPKFLITVWHGEGNSFWFLMRLKEPDYPKDGWECVATLYSAQDADDALKKAELEAAGYFLRRFYFSWKARDSTRKEVKKCG